MSQTVSESGSLDISENTVFKMCVQGQNHQISKRTLLKTCPKSSLLTFLENEYRKLKVTGEDERIQVDTNPKFFVPVLDCITNQGCVPKLEDAYSCQMFESMMCRYGIDFTR